MKIAESCIICKNSKLKKSPAVLMPFLAHRIFEWKPVNISGNWKLKTIKNGMVYSICNTAQCMECGLIFLDIRFNKREMNRLYKGYREKEYTDLRDKYEPGYKHKNKELNTTISYIADVENFLSPYLKFPINLLDWGGDTGKNSPFKNKTRTFHIYDISDKPLVKRAEKVDKTTIINTNYDLIVCSNVLEHVPYPKEEITNIKKSMQKDTLLYIEIPYEDIFHDSDLQEQKNLYKKKKYWHEHINFFTEISLKKLFYICGLSIIDSKKIKKLIGAKKINLYQFLTKLQ